MQIQKEAFTYAEYLNTLAKLTPLKEKTQFYYALFSENGFDEKITADTKSSGTLLFLEQIVNYSWHIFWINLKTALEYESGFLSQ